MDIHTLKLKTVDGEEIEIQVSEKKAKSIEEEYDKSAPIEEVKIIGDGKDEGRKLIIRKEDISRLEFIPQKE